MLFSSSNFILPFLVSDRVIQFQDVNNTRICGINVCNLSKAMTEANLMWITLGDYKIVLTFANGGDARLALNLLQTTVSQLQLNCVINGGGNGDKNYVHIQNTASANWTVTHNLGKIPTIILLDHSNQEMIADIVLDGGAPLDVFHVNFSEPFTGKAVCN